MRASIALIACAISLGPSTLALAGATGGAKAVVERVAPAATDVYDVEFAAEEIAWVSLTGDHATNLDLAVYDASGNLIASDTGDTDTAYVSFIPGRTGRFRLKVENRGERVNEYVLVTN